MRVADARPQATAVAALAERLAATRIDEIPLLAFRLPALEQTAWRDGLRAARILERRASAAFADAAACVLRAEDLIAHDPGSDTFVAALVAPMRDGKRALIPLDIRSALARIEATIEGRTRLDVDAGWSMFDAASMRIEHAIAQALVRGLQERERYAFFSAVGHELRTPLASIRGYLETLLDDGLDGATRKRFVGIAYNEALRLARLLEGMFEISLLDLTVACGSRGEGTLDVALSGAADACAAGASARSVVLRIAAAAPIYVALDTERLMLVLINLIDNAIKHGRAGGTVTVGVDARHARAVMVTVDDDGPGVAPAERDRIFALGRRGSSAAPGSGIGLALVRMILERAGGRVEVATAPGGGARFRVALPRSGVAAAQAEIGAQAAD